MDCISRDIINKDEAFRDIYDTDAHLKSDIFLNENYYENVKYNLKLKKGDCVGYETVDNQYRVCILKEVTFY